MKTYRMLAASFLAFTLVVAHGVAQTASGEYHIAETYKLGAAGSYDYMTFDPGAHLIYIAQGEQFLVFDITKGAVTGAIKGLVHVHGVVLAEDGVTGYISDGGAGVVQIFNRSTLAKTGSIAVGTNPDGMVLEPTTGHLFVGNGKSKTLSIIDLAARQVIATLPLPGKPEFPVTDSKGSVFIPIEDTHQLVKVSAASNKIVATWLLAGCEGPAGMAADGSNGLIFPACDNAKMPVIDGATGRVLTTLSIGTGPDAATYDATRHLLFSSNGDAGTLSILQQVSRGGYKPVQTVKTSKGARTLALDPATGDIYVLSPVPESTAPAATKPLVLYKIVK